MDFNLEHSITILRRTPATLEALLQDLPDKWLHSNEGEGSWSPFEIVGHLLHGEETDWIPRARLIMKEGESATFEPFDRTAMISEYKGLSLKNLVIEHFYDFWKKEGISIPRLLGSYGPMQKLPKSKDT